MGGGSNAERGVIDLSEGKGDAPTWDSRNNAPT